MRVCSFLLLYRFGIITRRIVSTNQVGERVVVLGLLAAAELLLEFGNERVVVVFIIRCGGLRRALALLLFELLLL